MALEEHDFVELDYTGKLVDGTIFDTTRKDIAKKLEGYNAKAEYKPIIVCIGERQVVPGLDKALVGKNAGDTFTITILAEEGFGKKDAKLIRLVPLRKFIKEDIMPVPGLQVDVDGMRAIVVRAGGGRVLVDFNHPLAGKEIVYEVAIMRQITDATEKIINYLSMIFPFKVEVTAAGENVTATLPQDVPEEILARLKAKLHELTGADIKFISIGKKEEATFAAINKEDSSAVKVEGEHNTKENKGDMEPARKSRKKKQEVQSQLMP